jgi:NADPH2:quinone reductase
VIIDIDGGAAMPAFIDRLAPNGRMVVAGVVAGLPPADFGMRLMGAGAFQQSRSFATFSHPAPRRGVAAGSGPAACRRPG